MAAESGGDKNQNLKASLVSCHKQSGKEERPS